MKINYKFQPRLFIIKRDFNSYLLLCLFVGLIWSNKINAQIYCAPTFGGTACFSPPYLDFSIRSASFSGTSFYSNGACPTNYGDYYSSVSATLTQGSSYSLTVDYNSSSSLVAFSIYCGAWIDWNNDGTFDDATERIMTSNVGPAGAITQTGASFSAAAVGTYRMRVIIQTGSNPTNPCTTGGGENGEVKDFKIIVNPIQVGLIGFNDSNFSIFPNPSNLKGVYIKGLPNENKQLQLRLIDILGNSIEHKTILNQKAGEQQFISFNEALEGIYLLEIYNGISIHQRKIVLQN